MESFKDNKKEYQIYQTIYDKAKSIAFYQNDAFCDWDNADTALFTWNGGTGGGIG